MEQYQRFHIDPSTKTIDLAPRSDNNHRRPNSKLSSYKREAKKSTPILGSDATEIDHLTLRKTLKSIHKNNHDLSDYTLTGDHRFEGMSYHQFQKEKTFGEKVRDKEPVTMYHGTSVKRAKEIMKTGLKPNSRGETYVDQIPGHSEHHVYLSTTPHEASNYATRQAIDDGSHPAILKVVVHPHDHGKFGPDEDHMHMLHHDDPEHKWFTGKHPATKDNPYAHIKSMTTGTLQYTNPDFVGPHPNRFHHWRADRSQIDKKRDLTFDKPYWTHNLTGVPDGQEEHKYRETLGHDFKRAILNKASRRTESKTSFGFRGHIKPENISVHQTWKKQSVDMHPDTPSYYAAIDKMRATVKNKL